MMGWLRAGVVGGWELEHNAAQSSFLGSHSQHLWLWSLLYLPPEYRVVPGGPGGRLGPGQLARGVTCHWLILSAHVSGALTPH